MVFGRRTQSSKYGNKKVEYDGLKFDSQKEMKRYILLNEAEGKGLISDLKTQVKFELIPSIKETYTKHLKTKDKECKRTIQLPITYTCDFQYIKDDKVVVEDVKASPKTASLDKAFLIKEKLFRWKFGFSIKRVYKPNDEI